MPPPGPPPASGDTLSEERLRLAVEAAALGTWDFDLATGVINQSPRLLEVLGLPPGSAVSHVETWKDLVHPDDLEHIRGQFLAAAAGGRQFEAETRVVRPDGQVRWVVVRGSVLRDANGRPQRAIGVLTDATERRQAEQALRESEARYRDLFENANDIIYTLDLAGRITSVNRRAELTFGYSREECLGRDASEMVPAEHHPRMREAMRRKLEGDTAPTVYEMEIVSKDGTRVPVEINSRLILEGGKPVGIQGIARDISERKRTFQALRESERRFHQLADNLPAGFIYQIVQQPDGQRFFSYVSGGVEAVCGVPLAEALSDPLAMYGLIVPEDQALVLTREEEAYRHGGPFDCQFRLRTRGGELRWLHCRSAPRALDDGGAVWDGIAVDITARKLAEEALRESEERLRLALEAGEIGAWDWDVLANRVTWSERIYAFHGLRPGEFAGRVEDSSRWVHPEDAGRVDEAIRVSLQRGEPYGLEFRVVRPSGEVRWLAANGRVYFDNAGNPVRMLGAAQDVTERRAAEEALKEADRRKDEFLAMLAHELRNPLAPIRNSVQVLKLVGVGDGTVATARDMIERQVTHMARLVDDLLDVSRITRGKILLRKQPLDLVPLVRAAAEDHRCMLSDTGLALTVELPPGPVWVDGDPTRLSQVVGNLLHNANKFTDAGGAVLVHLETVEMDAPTARLLVKDTGIGMDEGMLTRLFLPFSQADRSLARSRGGLGLGLALVKGLVELHGGCVEARSAGAGKGSEIEIRLPLCVTHGERLASNGDYVSGRPQRVLLIEDNRDAAESLRLLLTLSGHEVAVAYTGQAGLERARKFRPDLVLCDIGLPGGLDGYAVVRALRADPELFGVTAVALSGYGQEEDLRKARQAGFDHHLTKPAAPEELQRLLGGRGR
jgi:PAS domain S-box-containing protein